MLPFFTVCHGKAHGKSAIFCRVPVHVAHGKGGILCRVPDHVAHGKLSMWHAESTGQLYFAVGPRKHTARKRTHGKYTVCRTSFAVCCLSCVTYGKDSLFAVCFGTRQSHCFPCVLAHGKPTVSPGVRTWTPRFMHDSAYTSPERPSQGTALVCLRSRHQLKHIS